MTLSCSCNDFDKGEYDHWWGPGRPSVPPAGERCCECKAPLPHDPCKCIWHMEAYEPDGNPPPHPDDLPGVEAEALSDKEAEAMERAHFDWKDENGWDDECERYERDGDTDFRCERCSDLAASIEDLGYCMIGPGDLIEAHMEFIDAHHYAKRKWVSNAHGTLNPHPWTRADYVRDWYRRTCYEVGSWLRWKLRWKINHFKWRVIYAIKRAFA
jgi:hypothetical protein